MSKKIKKKKTVNKTASKLSAKKIVYVALTIFLGELLGLIAFEVISINFVSLLERAALPVEYEQIFGMIYSPLPVYLFWTLIFVGAVGGFFLGLTWWQIVYVEHRHWRNRIK